MTSHAATLHRRHDEHHGPPPANQSSRVDARVLGMLLFIGSEIMLFGSFFAAYFFIRAVNPDSSTITPHGWAYSPRLPRAPPPPASPIPPGAGQYGPPCKEPPVGGQCTAGQFEFPVFVAGVN